MLFRTFDVRLYHAFGSNEIIRETKGRQATYEEIKKVSRISPVITALADKIPQRLPLDRKDDLTPLTDINWVSAQLESLAASPSSRLPPAATSRDFPSSVTLSGLSLDDQARVPPWDGEGRVLEIMEIGNTI